MTLQDRLAAARRRDDDGAALIIAVVFVTVVAVVVASILALADANLRGTIALRKQAAQSANADGAAEAAINALRQGSYVGPGNCFGATPDLTLSNFYQPLTGGAADSAYVACSQDLDNSVPSIKTTRPGYALLTLGNVVGEDGIFLKANGTNGGIWAKGAIGARSNINIFAGNMRVTGDVRATSCSPTGISIDAGTGTKTCTAAAGAAITDPGYALPPPPDATMSVQTTSPKCQADMQFSAGVYPDISVISNWMSSCNKAKVYDFRPGVYYFYSGTFTFNSNIPLIGGRVDAVPTSPVPDLSKSQGYCTNQTNTITPNPLPAGVTFVFGGTAQMTVDNNSQVELCGIYSKTGPPIALYGLKTTLGTGTLKMDPLTTTNPDYAFFWTDQNSTNIYLYLEGTVYAPTGFLDLDLRKSTSQFFLDGVAVRRFRVFAPASAIPPTPLASTPTTSPGPARTVANLSVYVCPGQSTCSAATGTLRLKVKVGLGDPASAPSPGQREITVYSWSVQR
jgi:hypothetical protein